jgi:FtsP/CotA-like multicopper oxidase with cupredoxin domain
LRNNADAPFPAGDPANFNPDTVGQIIKFIVGSKPGFKARTLPANLNPTLPGNSWPVLANTGNQRILTLNEQLDPAGNSVGLFLNGQMWDAPTSETPRVNSAEDWFFVNLTADTHPMHLHLVQFNVYSRQDFDNDRYLTDWLALNKNGLMDGGLPFKMSWQTRTLPIEPYLKPGTVTYALPEERGWKDIVAAYPGQVTRIRVRFKKQNGAPYSFDPTQGPGYVWHCHIIDHEDNEMMRRMTLRY